MQLKNNHQRYGLIAIILHWLIALTTFGLFALGLWMTDLGYYDAWYQKAPRLHEGFGTILFLFLLTRIIWRWINKPPNSIDTHKPWEKFASHLTHHSLNLLLVLISISGYLIITAKGEPLAIFDLLKIPASLSGIPNQADIAGDIHYYSACIIIILASIHALAALKHHFIDKDNSLRRMLRLS